MPLIILNFGEEIIHPLKLTHNRSGVFMVVLLNVIYLIIVIFLPEDTLRNDGTCSAIM